MDRKQPSREITFTVEMTVKVIADDWVPQNSLDAVPAADVKKILLESLRLTEHGGVGYIGPTEDNFYLTDITEIWVAEGIAPPWVKDQ